MSPLPTVQAWPHGDRLAAPERPRRGLARPGGLSLLLHGLVLAALLWSVARTHMNDVTTGSEIAVVFEGGPSASTPQTEESRHAAPTEAPDPHATEPAPPGQVAARPAPAQPPAAPPAAPEIVQAMPGATVTPSPRLAAGTAALTLPPPAVVRVPGAAAVPAHRPPSRHTTDSAFASLSAPMNLSLAGHPPPPASAGHLKRGINLSMAPTDQNKNVMTRYAEARHKLGEDWWAAFSAYVEAHKYYPEAAAKKGEDGQVVLHLVIERDGTVRSVSVELSSGSPQLDMAWVSEFRGNKVPPFPPGTIENEYSFPASMTYILEHL